MAQLRLSALAALALAAGCGGGSATTPAPVAAHVAPSHTGTVALSLLVPRVASARARTPRYLSAATKSVVVTVTSEPPQGFDVGPSSPNCTAGANGTTCTLSVIAPIAYDTFAIAAYDMPRAADGSGQGNVLSDGSIQLYVNEGSDNKIQLSLGGNVATVALDVPDPHPWYWVGRFVDGKVVAKDAAGYTIVGYYDAKIALTISPQGPNWQNPTPLLTSGDGLHYLAFWGQPSGPVTLTATAANNATDSKVLTPTVESGTVAVTAPNINIYVDVPYNRTLNYNVIATTTLYGAFATPRAAAFDAAGNVYMTDNGPASSASPSGPAVWVFPAGYCYGCTAAPKPLVLGSAAFGNSAPLVLASDAANNALYVATADAVYRFALPLTASSTPATVISGAATGLANVTGLAVGANELAVALGSASVLTFAKTANGNAAPQRVIAGAATTLQSPQGLAYDANGNLWVADATTNDVAVFAPGANGNAAPSSSLGGSASALNAPQGVAFDHTGVVYVVDHSGRTRVYAAGATGNVTPQSSINGATKANGIAVFP